MLTRLLEITGVDSKFLSFTDTSVDVLPNSQLEIKNMSVIVIP